MTSKEIDNWDLRPAIYFPAQYANYPVDRADQRLPYVNYMPVHRISKLWAKGGPCIEVYSPQNGTPESAIGECFLRAEGNWERSSGMGMPMIRRQEACMNSLRWSERKARDPEKFF